MIVVLVVQTSDLGDPSTHAMTHTVEDSLGGGAVVIVRDGGQSDLSDPAATSLGGLLHADVVAVVTWSHPERATARVHLYNTRESAWVDRALSFRPEDPPSERGNMLGFAIAAMVPSSEAAPTPPGPEAPRPSPPPARVEPAPHALVSIDAAAFAAGGIGGSADGLGAIGAVRVWLTEAVALMGEAGFRAGSMPSAHASTNVARFGGGAASRLYSFGAERPFAVGARLELLALRHGVSSNDTSSSGSRWVPGIDASAEGAWNLTPSFGVVGAFGVEVATGTTRVYLDAERVETIPPFRLAGSLGARVSF